MLHSLEGQKQFAGPGEPEPALRMEMERRLIAHADRIIAATEEERTQMIRHCGATAGQVQVIPCGVDLKHFVPQDKLHAREALKLDLEQPVLLLAGRLDPFKGPDILLHAAAMMRAKGH